MWQEYKWKIGGELQTPTRDDLEKTITKMLETLDSEPDNSQIEVGHLLLKKERGEVALYLHFGDLDEQRS